MFKWLRKLRAEIKAEEAKQPLFVCCGNCDNYDAGNYPHSGKKPRTDKRGFCPNIYWPYNINWVSDGWFCRDDFKVATRLADTHKADWKSREGQEDVIDDLKRRKVKRRSAMISDSPIGK